jgi:Ni,Fe-hydrogenase III large subunit
MPGLNDLFRDSSPAATQPPWRRFPVTSDQWIAAASGLSAERWSLLGLWGDDGAVHMALHDAGDRVFAILTLACPDGTFPSVARLFPPAARFERSVRDLYGLEPLGAADTRPWLDHGAAPTAYPFLPAEGEGLHQIPVGPVHAGIIEPGHFRFTAGGETIVRLEQRLGYVHKGTEGLIAGAEIARAAQLAGRVSGDSTVAYALAFARAMESACGVAAPLRAEWLRALMAELERLANHLGDIGAICNDAAFAALHAHCGALREEVLRAAGFCFGHRLMMDRVVPGGVAGDLPPEGALRLAGLVDLVRRRFPELVRVYDNSASLQDRMVGTGTLDPGLARRFAAGGYVGRASGRDFDARRDAAYPPYGLLRFIVPTRAEGDVNARVWLRIAEVEQSLTLVEQILHGLPDGPIRADIVPPRDPAEGVALVEGFRGDVLVWLRLDGGVIGRCHLRDPSWLQWPLLEAAVEGNIVADFPLCNKSFNCSYSGHDL